MSTQPMIRDEVTTPVEAAKTDSLSRPKWPLLAAVAFLILIEVGGTVHGSACYSASTPTQFEYFRTIDFERSGGSGSEIVFCLLVEHFSAVASPGQLAARTQEHGQLQRFEVEG